MSNETQIISKLSKATQSVSKVVAELNELTEKEVTLRMDQIEDLDRTIAEKTVELNTLVLEKQGELDAIEKKNEIKVREAKIDFDLQLKEHKDSAILAVIGDDNQVVSKSEISDLNDQLDSAEDAQKAAVAKAVEAEKRNSTNALNTLKLENAASTAKASADLEAANKEITFLKSQISKYEAQIDAIREADVKKAQAATPQIVRESK